MTKREQLFALARNLRWIILLSILISLLVCLPGQIQELYRIAADDFGWVVFQEFVALVVIATTIWLAAFQLTTASLPDSANGAGYSVIYRLAPVVLGALPMAAAIVGQILSRPDYKPGVEEVGSIFRIQSQSLAFERNVLWILAIIILVLLMAFGLTAWWIGKKDRFTVISRAANEYFSRCKFLFLTIFGTVLITTVFILLPAALPQLIGSFGVLTLFTICVVAVTIHFALLTIRSGIPFIPIIFGLLLLIAAISGADDHELRPAVEAVAGDARISAETAFQNWLSQPSRVAEANRLGEYPVFVVTAQGGGIYAAHNAASFLARMQDLCPTFRQHLFAISSVSGGSVGAATFAAALHADGTSSNPPTVDGKTCDSVADFLNGTITRREKDKFDTPGAVEQRVGTVLKADFLAPLIAGLLFTDFTQLFFPVAVPSFDRARFLEYAFEGAGDKILETQKDGVKQSNLLRADFQSHWAPDNNMPALLLNTTDVGNGKRVVIAPFDIDPSHPKGKDLCTLARVKRTKVDDNEIVVSQSLHIPLSTAAFASARFPWVMPASTVTLKTEAHPEGNDCITALPRARLVDGGYLENSGVETALDLIQTIRSIKGANLPKFRIYLLSLANGDFGDHGSFEFGEVMEPIRALFSTQGVRTYIALDRAESMDLPGGQNAAPGGPSLPTFGRTNITGLFYNLPLGWTLSEETAGIIAQGSGRFWDCVPSSTFVQLRPNQSNADCLQMRIFHLLHGDVPSAFQALEEARLAAGQYASVDRPKTAKIAPERLLACYEREWLQDRGYQRYLRNVKELEKAQKAIPPYRKSYLAYFQAEQVKALLQEWDRIEETDPHILAYLLGSVSYDSVDFIRTGENFWYNDVSLIPSKWRKRINESNAALVAAGKPPVDVASLLTDPKKLANLALGGEGNEFGNVPETDDGWNFRPRGMYQLIGREQYQKAQTELQQLGQLPGLDLTKSFDALWDANISARVTFAHFRAHPYKGRTLFDLLKDSSLDWKTVRSLQTDMENDLADQDNVNVKSEMFLGCIEEAQHPSWLKTWWRQFKGEE